MTGESQGEASAHRLVACPCLHVRVHLCRYVRMHLPRRIRAAMCCKLQDVTVVHDTPSRSCNNRSHSWSESIKTG